MHSYEYWMRVVALYMKFDKHLSTTFYIEPSLQHLPFRQNSTRRRRLIPIIDGHWRWPSRLLSPVEKSERHVPWTKPVQSKIP